MTTNASENAAPRKACSTSVPGFFRRSVTQVDIYSVGQKSFAEAIHRRNVDLRTALGDVVDDYFDVLRLEIESNGSAMFGGGASPLYRITPAQESSSWPKKSPPSSA